MADNARLVFRQPITKSIGNFVIDVFSSETHTNTATLTKYPIEDGSPVSDHVVIQPVVLNLQGLIEAKEEGQNILTAYDDLQALQEAKELLTVVTGLKVYDNMIITNFVVNRTVQNGGSLPLQITLTEARVKQSQSITIPVDQLSRVDEETFQQAQQQVDAGKVSWAQEITNELEAVKKAVGDSFEELFPGFESVQ